MYTCIIAFRWQRKGKWGNVIKRCTPSEHSFYNNALLTALQCTAIKLMQARIPSTRYLSTSFVGLPQIGEVTVVSRRAPATLTVDLIYKMKNWYWPFVCCLTSVDSVGLLPSNFFLLPQQQSYIKNINHTGLGHPKSRQISKYHGFFKSYRILVVDWN